eukprot:Clim_evm14s10 gene=Clim_evmTU14s10
MAVQKRPGKGNSIGLSPQQSNESALTGRRKLMLSSTSSSSSMPMLCVLALVFTVFSLLFVWHSSVESIAKQQRPMIQAVDANLDLARYADAKQAYAALASQSTGHNFTADELFYVQFGVVIAEIAEQIEKWEFEKAKGNFFVDRESERIAALVKPLDEFLSRNKAQDGTGHIEQKQSTPQINNEMSSPREDYRYRRHILAPLAGLQDRFDEQLNILSELVNVRSSSSTGTEPHPLDLIHHAEAMFAHRPGQEVSAIRDRLLSALRHENLRHNSTRGKGKAIDRGQSPTDARMTYYTLELHRLIAEASGSWLADYRTAEKHYRRVSSDLPDDHPARDSPSFTAMFYEYAAVCAALGKRELSVRIMGGVSPFARPFSARIAAYTKTDRADEVLGRFRKPANRNTDLVRVFDHAQSDSIYTGLARAFGKSSSFWTAIDYFSGNRGKGVTFFSHFPFPREGEPGRSVMHQVVEQMLAYIEPEVVKTLSGVEWWVHMRPSHPDQRVMPGHPFHFDVDEDLRAMGTVRSPIWSSVFFVEGDTGGQTVVMEWDPSMDADDPKFPRGAYMVTPTDNRFMLFRGSLHHGVMPGFPEDLDPVTHRPIGHRITLLVNFWDHPTPVIESQPFDVRHQTLQVMDPQLLSLIPELAPIELPPDHLSPEHHARTYALDIKPIYEAEALE